MSQAQQRVMRDLAACRTAKLGGHVDACDACGEVRVSYNSCRNRHCPKCQAQQRATWLENRCHDLLPVPYFHVVFTLPAELAPLALQNQRAIYGALFAAAAATLRTIAADPKHLGADIGFIAVLHTWGQTLVHHPHLHCVIPGGGLSPDGTDWISCRNGFFLPVRVLSKLFRGKMLAALQEHFAADRLQFHGALSELADPGRFRALCEQLRAKQWVVYSKPPFGGPEQVLKYLARYTHRVAIANSRITAADADSVSFRYQDYAGGHRHRMMQLDAVEFLRRFLQHVLPDRFVRIRHYGFLANRARKEKLPLCRRLIARATGNDMIAAPALETATDDGERCPACQQGTMRRIQEFRSQTTWEYRPLRRGPPDTA
ncbi:MAG: IS91 family transposase [Spirochaetaceae bacterium]|nr:IS91 family transposase [Spirochaetaceae bacterium]